MSQQTVGFIEYTAQGGDTFDIKAEDGKQSVAAYVAQVAKANGANVTVKGFVRFETGEGMEKKNEDFAAEVAAQLGK